ncbi:unnamed protein product [Rhizophagus irregularis]|nr:unnamed protein product [Rhizophagus irregularis]CAB5393334.1 unnamed protein product [Rhizophagus irregularis]
MKDQKKRGRSPKKKDRKKCKKFRPELGNGDRFRPVNLKLGSILACNSEMGTDFSPELRNGDRFWPGTQKWRPILACNSEMETNFSPELENGDRDMDSWIIIQTVTDRYPICD